MYPFPGSTQVMLAGGAMVFLSVLFLQKIHSTFLWLLLPFLGYGLHYKASLPFLKPLPAAGTIVLDEEEYSGSAWRRYRAKLVATRTSKGWETDERNILVYIKQEYPIGQQLVFQGKITLPAPPLHPFAFDYRQYLKHSGFHGTAFLLEENVVPTDTLNDARHRVARVRQSVKDQIFEWMEDPIHAQLLLGILLGEKRGMDANLRRTYSVTGSMHVLAVSGLHVGLIYGIIKWLLSWLPGFAAVRTWRSFLTISLLVVYAALAGFTPSVTRAVTFLALVMISSLLKRPNPLPHVLFLTAFMMLVYDPFQLFQVSFQLSFLAILGILLFMPMLEPWFAHRWWVINMMLKNVSLSLAVQCSTLFLTVAYFHQLSLSFWLSSMLVVPMAFLLLLGSILLFVFQFIPVVHSWLVAGMAWLITFLNNGLEWMEALPYSHISNFYLPSYVLLSIPVLLYFTWYMFQTKQSKYLWGVLILIPFTVIGYSRYSSHVRKIHSTVIFTQRNQWVLGHIRQGKGMLLYDSANVPGEDWMHFTIQPWFTAQSIRDIAFHRLPVTSSGLIQVKIDTATMVFSPKTNNFPTTNPRQAAGGMLLYWKNGEDTLYIDLAREHFYSLNPVP